jgi:hypothetical protein
MVAARPVEFPDAVTGMPFAGVFGLVDAESGQPCCQNPLKIMIDEVDL